MLGLRNPVSASLRYSAKEVTRIGKQISMIPVPKSIFDLKERRA